MFIDIRETPRDSFQAHAELRESPVGTVVPSAMDVLFLPVSVCLCICQQDYGE